MSYQRHGLRNHLLYIMWLNMKKRCKSTDAQWYMHYKAKGIKVCGEWINDFKTFYDFCQSNGWEKGLEIDRIDNDKGYSPENCRFVTRRENILNQGMLRADSKSGYTGVSYKKLVSKWESYICVKGNNARLGCYSTPEKALIARNNYIINNGLEHEYKIQPIRPELT